VSVDLKSVVINFMFFISHCVFSCEVLAIVAAGHIRDNIDVFSLHKISRSLIHKPIEYQPLDFVPKQ